jgi:hypothetical protein
VVSLSSNQCFALPAPTSCRFTCEPKPPNWSVREFVTQDVLRKNVLPPASGAVKWSAAV